MEKDVFAELCWRGLVEQHTVEIEKILRETDERLTVYCGFDPTARSLHVGSLRPIVGLAWFQRYGHRPIAVVGGATGRIGDPSGKTNERQLLSLEEIGRNVEGIRRQLGRFLDFAPGPAAALMVDNADWLAPWPLLDFLRDVGKHFRVGQMLAKESVRSRMGTAWGGADSIASAAAGTGGVTRGAGQTEAAGGAEAGGEGISFTEFSYMLLQAADFLHLFRTHGCTLQIGGGDQWGNITAGIELIRRLEGKPAHALTFPLVTTAAGHKFGKTEAGTVWLDPELTSPYDFYQFWIRTDDRDVVSFLRSMTFLEHEEIDELARRHREHPEKREAHARLAHTLTAMVHGADEADRARQAARRLFGAGVAAGEVEGAPRTEIARAELEAGVALGDVLLRCGLVKSKGEARRLVAGGGVYLNDERVADPQRVLGVADLRGDGTLLLRTGKRNYHVVHAT